QVGAGMAADRRQAGLMPRKDQSPEPEHSGDRNPLRRRARGRSADGMRCRSDQGGPVRADRRAGNPLQEVTRSLLAVVALAVGMVGAAAQSPPTQSPPAQAQPAAVTGNPNLRSLPDGPGRRVAELQGLDKVTARTQRFYAPVGQPVRFGTLEITVGDCL